MFGVLLASAIAGTWIYSELRVADAAVEAIEASTRAIDRVAPEEPVTPEPAAKPVKLLRADQVARDSASHACVQDGLGPLRIERVAVRGDQWDITGQAGSRRVVVRLREFTGPRGSATFRVQAVERL